MERLPCFYHCSFDHDYSCSGYSSTFTDCLSIKLFLYPDL